MVELAYLLVDGPVGVLGGHLPGDAPHLRMVSDERARRHGEGALDALGQRHAPVSLGSHLVSTLAHPVVVGPRPASHPWRWRELLLDRPPVVHQPGVGEAAGVDEPRAVPAAGEAAP